MKRIPVLLMIVISLFTLVACNWFDDNDKDKNDSASTSWQRIEAFTDTPILAMYVNSDSTELHVVTTASYGYHAAGEATDTFRQHFLTFPYTYDASTWVADGIPYFTDNYCFCNTADGKKIIIYGIGNNSWTRMGEIDIQDFIPDSTNMTARFARPHWMNQSNHIIHASGDLYYITTEKSPVTGSEPYCTQYQQFLVNLHVDAPFHYSIVYADEPQTQQCGYTCAFSTHYICGRFIQEYYSDYLQPVHVILVPESSSLIPGTGRYPLRDIFRSHNDQFLIGVGDGVLMCSMNQGVDWNELGEINGPWSYARIAQKHIFFYICNIALWNATNELTDEQTEMLDGTGLGTAKIHYLVQFGDYVYAGTNEGLFVKPLSHFFERRATTNRSRSNNLQIQSNFK